MDDAEYQRMKTMVHGRLERLMATPCADMRADALINHCRRFWDDRNYAMYTLRVAGLRGGQRPGEAQATYVRENVGVPAFLMRCHRYWREVCQPQMNITFASYRLRFFLNTYQRLCPLGGAPDHLSDGMSAICRYHIRFRERRMQEPNRFLPMLFGQLPLEHDHTLSYGDNVNKLVALKLDFEDWVTFATAAPDNQRFYLEAVLDTMLPLQIDVNTLLRDVLIERDTAVWNSAREGPQSHLGSLSTDVVRKIIRYTNNAKD